MKEISSTSATVEVTFVAYDVYQQEGGDGELLGFVPDLSMRGVDNSI